MGKLMFKWFIEIPAAFHTWITFAAWLIAGADFVYMAAKGVEIHVLLALGLISVGGASLIGNHLPPLLRRWADMDQYKKVAVIVEEYGGAVGPTVTVPEAALIWSEITEDAQNTVKRYLKFKKLKAWVDSKALPVDALNGANANVKTTLKTADLAAFFRRGCQ